LLKLIIDTMSTPVKKVEPKPVKVEEPVLTGVAAIRSKAAAKKAKAK
jgi:hypothetical protein